jgi:outer membrane protein assembly factor BamB
MKTICDCVRRSRQRYCLSPTAVARRRIDTAVRLLGAVCVLVAWPIHLAAGQEYQPSNDSSSADLAGLWAGPIQHNGQESRFVLSLAPAENDSLTVRISIPAIDVWDLPIGSAVREGHGIRIGSWTLTHDVQEGALLGTLPPALVPVHEIALTLRKIGRLERLKLSKITAPKATPLWTGDTDGPIWAALSVSGGVVYVGSDDGTLYAFRVENGDLVWRFSTGGPIRAGPTVDGPHVYLHSDDGHLYKLEADTGRSVWRVKMEDAVERIPPGERGSRYDHYASAATVVEGAVYVGGHDGSLHTFDADTGRETRHYATGDAIVSAPAQSNGVLTFGSFDGRVYAVDALSGKEVWRFDTGAPVVSTPAINEDRAIVGSRSFDLFALDITDGHILWTFYCWFSWIESSAAILDGTVYVGSSDAQRLYAIDAASGSPKWEFDTGGSVWARPAVTEDAVYAGAVGVADYIVDHEGGFFAIDRTTGEARWQFETEPKEGSKLWGFGSSPAVGGGVVLVGRLDGQVYAFKTRSP